MMLLGIHGALSTALVCVSILCLFALWWPTLKRLEVKAALASRAPLSPIPLDPTLELVPEKVRICPYVAEPPTTANALPALRRWRERVLGLASRAVAAAPVERTSRAAAAPRTTKKKVKTLPPRAPKKPRRTAPPPSDDAPTAIWIAAPELDFVVQRPQW
jgi:hypothetical protein